ncbi:hypothetical protein ACF0H5_012023 [Mactra antiquata]
MENKYSSSLNQGQYSYEAQVAGSSQAPGSTNDFPELWGTYMSAAMWKEMKAWERETEEIVSVELKAKSVDRCMDKKSDKRKRSHSPDYCVDTKRAKYHDYYYSSSSNHNLSYSKYPIDNRYQLDRRPKVETVRHHYDSSRYSIDRRPKVEAERCHYDSSRYSIDRRPGHSTQIQSMVYHVNKSHFSFSQYFH